MKISYRLTQDEAGEISRRYASSLDHYFGSPSVKRLYRLLLIPLFIWIATELTQQLYISVAIVLACFLGQEAAQRIYSMFYRKNLYSSGNQSYQLQEWKVSDSDDGLLFDGELGRTVYFWKTIQFLSDDDEYVYIFISKAQLVAIPKRAFAAKEEESRFREMISDGIKQHSEQSNAG